MSKPLPLYCATDNEIFDTLMSAPQHFNSRTLRNMGLRRGILYSAADTRDDIVDRLSTLHYGAGQIWEIQEHFDYRGRGEKKKVIRLNQEFTISEIQKAVNSLRTAVTGDEKIYTVANGPSALDVNVQYTDVDFSLVRLRQRQRREASMSFEIEDGITVITAPAGVRAGAYLEDLKAALISERKEPTTTEAVTLSSLQSALAKTSFFLQLISALPGFTLRTVLKVNVERAHKQDKSLTNDELTEPSEDHNEEDVEMLGVVQGVALRGEDLLQSRVYQDLRRRHYYIVSIRWRASLNTSPFPLIEFEAGFDDSEIGGAFRFSVLGRFAQRVPGQYNKTISPLPDAEKRLYFKALDQQSLVIYRSLSESVNGVESVDKVAPAEVL